MEKTKVQGLTSSSPHPALLGRRKKSSKTPDSSLDGRTLLIKTFIRLCHWNSIESVTLQKVAKAAGLAFNAAHYHFGGHTEGITQAALLYIRQSLTNFSSKLVTEALERAEKNPLRAYVTSQFLWIDKYKDLGSLWVYSQYLSSTHSPLKKIFSDEMKASRLQIKRLLLEGSGLGTYSQQLIEVDALAMKIHNGIISGMFMKMMDHSKSPAEHLNACLNSVDALIRSHFKSRKHYLD